MWHLITMASDDHDYSWSDQEYFEIQSNNSLVNIMDIPFGTILILYLDKFYEHFVNITN